MTASKDPFILMDTGDGIFGRCTPQEVMDALLDSGVRPSAWEAAALSELSDRAVLERERNDAISRANLAEHYRKIALYCNEDLNKKLADMTTERDYWKLKAESK